ncbi:hypothetical protein GIB67_015503 [Kingdonia uniflora]|uniref:Uncharacterized protein n=1 Tax=Kingdonia uniflora TaxID=39325 RepID=A0A7J7LA59_9MAGN|nr:hypothetical protein GIB67_015503 [Kingdonia uniflora]
MMKNLWKATKKVKLLAVQYSDNPYQASLATFTTTRYGCRPDFGEFFDSVCESWGHVDMGVIVCGPQSIESSVAKECRFIHLLYATNRSEKAFLMSAYGKGDDKSFRVSINGFEFHIGSDDIRHAFGLSEFVVPDEEHSEWPPILSEFPPNREMEELRVAGKMKVPYLRRKNLSPTLCLFHMIADCS